MSVRNPNIVNKKQRKKVAIVIANQGISTVTQWPVGFWWSELTHPYFFFRERGYEVDVFSPQGGRCMADTLSDPKDSSGYSQDDLISAGFMASPQLVSLVENTQPVDLVTVERYDAIVVAGGQSPLFTFEKAKNLHKVFADFYEAGKIACALCHGTALLRYVTLSNGEALVKGKTVTGFSNIEEDYADQAVWSMGALPKGTHLMPWRIEDELQKKGAHFIHGGLWKGFAIRDENLITGQQNFSGRETAQLVIDALGG